MNDNSIFKEDNIKQLITLGVQMGYVQKTTESIEKKIDNFANQFAAKDEVEAIKADVGSLMKWRYYFTGGAAAVGAMVSVLTQVAIKTFMGGK